MPATQQGLVTTPATSSTSPAAAPITAPIYVSPIGTSTTGVTVTNNGAQYGPDTVGTTTSGVQEALTALQATGGKIKLLQGAFQINTPLTYTSNFPLTIEGTTRGRRENIASPAGESPYWYGTYLLGNNLSSGQTVLTIQATTTNLGLCKLVDFAIRNQALSYVGSTIPNIFGLNFSGGSGSPSQISVDNVMFEYVTNPVVMNNFNNGPIDIGLIEFVFCSAGVNTALLALNAGTIDIKHIEEYGCNGPCFGITDSATDVHINVGSIFSGASDRIFNFGCAGGAPNTYLHIGQLYTTVSGSPTTFIRLLSTSGNASLFCVVDNMIWGGSSFSSPSGQIIEGTGDNTAGAVQVTINNFLGAPGNWVANNSASSVGAGSYLKVSNATLTGTPSADIPFANMVTNIKPVYAGYDGAVIADAPTIWWKLNETTGTTATDSSGNSHPGTYTIGTGTIGTAGPIVGNASETAFFTDGSTSKVNSSFNIPGGGQAALSVECWVNFLGITAASNNGLRIISCGHTDSTNNGFELWVVSAGNGVQWLVGNGAHTAAVNNPAAAPFLYPSTGWHHFVGTYSAGTASLYQDGLLVGTASLTGGGNITQDSGVVFNAGSLAYFSGSLQYANFIKAQISQVAYYTTALSAARVQAHYIAGAFA